MSSPSHHGFLAVTTPIDSHMPRRTAGFASMLPIYEALMVFDPAPRILVGQKTFIDFVLFRRLYCERQLMVSYQHAHRSTVCLMIASLLWTLLKISKLYDLRGTTGVQRRRGRLRAAPGHPALGVVAGPAPRAAVALVALLHRCAGHCLCHLARSATWAPRR